MKAAANPHSASDGLRFHFHQVATVVLARHVGIGDGHTYRYSIADVKSVAIGIQTERTGDLHTQR